MIETKWCNKFVVREGSSHDVQKQTDTEGKEMFFKNILSFACISKS